VVDLGGGEHLFPPVETWSGKIDPTGQEVPGRAQTRFELSRPCPL